MKNLFSCEDKKEILDELKERRRAVCFCGKPAKYMGYCFYHVPKEVKALYWERRILEKQALKDYIATPNDVQNPSTIPSKLKCVGGDCKRIVFAKIYQNRCVGYVHCPITYNGGLRE